MSLDLFYDYVFKGKSEDLRDVVEEHFDEEYFFPQSLGIDYPESFFYSNPYDSEEIIDQGINELRIRVLVVKRLNFTNQNVEWDVLNEFKNKYPDLEIDLEFIDG
ncbi:MAG: hypothetical protein IKV87_09330 [Methanobrevibacter sp.]|nr:hypothetical protein [Methanobrevibacter sp.]